MIWCESLEVAENPRHLTAGVGTSLLDISQRGFLGHGLRHDKPFVT